MTYLQICAQLKNAGIEDAEWDAQLLISHFCALERGDVLAFPNRELENESLIRAVERRIKREPLQYILGEWSFYRQIYEVSPDCLIPRSDTEILVEEAIRLLPPRACFADLCTGSGCIAISALAEREDTRAVAVELSEGALALAKRNAIRNGVEQRISFFRADVLDMGTDWHEKIGEFDAIFSNPPYIRSEVIPSLSAEVGHEPTMALDGGVDGLSFYRALLRLAPHCLKPNGFCLFEIGYDQGEQIRLLAEHAGFFCEIKKDYGGCDRVAYLTRRWE